MLCHFIFCARFASSADLFAGLFSMNWKNVLKNQNALLASFYAMYAASFCSAVVIRPHHICVAYRCNLYLAMFMVGLSVTLSVVGHVDVLWQKGWTDRDAVWHVGWGER